MHSAQMVTVNVNDLNLDSLAALKAGRLPFIEYGAEELLSKALRDSKLIFTGTPGEISNSGPVIVTIGTPVDEFLNPVHTVVQRCIDDLLPRIAAGDAAAPDGAEGPAAWHCGACLRAFSIRLISTGVQRG